jgi:hypothetical protein
MSVNGVKSDECNGRVSGQNQTPPNEIGFLGSVETYKEAIY